MAQRTVALYDGKYIGIETIYTVIGGKQINIPEKLRDLRQKSQNNELFCPCGCGANLILVAGDKNLREQHFRIKDADSYPDCHVVTEGKVSVDSKIVIKCWLDDNLHAVDLESRVPISAVDDINRKYEFTFIARSRGIAVNYCHYRANLSNEKLGILEANAKGIKIIHIVDQINGGSEGQYQEGLMKVQDRQGYCLLLSIEESDYDRAKMKAVFYGKDLDGLWQEQVFADDMLSKYRIVADGCLSFNGQSLEKMLSDARKAFSDQNETEKNRRIEEERKRQEYLRRQEVERQQRIEEERKRQAEFEERQRVQAEEAARLREETEKRKQIERQRREEEQRQREQEFKQNLETYLQQQEKPVRDAAGNRWIKCEFCGKIAMDDEFDSYGGPGHVNLGICKECSRNNPAVKQKLMQKPSDFGRKSYNPNVCPECGAVLKERNGIRGRFLGCSNFPRCRYTRSI